MLQKKQILKFPQFQKFRFRQRYGVIFRSFFIKEKEQHSNQRSLILYILTSYNGTQMDNDGTMMDNDCPMADNKKPGNNRVMPGNDRVILIQINN